MDLCWTSALCLSSACPLPAVWLLSSPSLQISAYLDDNKRTPSREDKNRSYNTRSTCTTYLLPTSDRFRSTKLPIPCLIHFRHRQLLESSSRHHSQRQYSQGQRATSSRYHPPSQSVSRHHTIINHPPRLLVVRCCPLQHQRPKMIITSLLRTDEPAET